MAADISLPGLDSVAARWRHEGAVRGLVLGLKLGGRRRYAGTLVCGMADLVAEVGTEASVVTWPPCSRADRRRRGYDHAEVLARGLAGRLGLPAGPLLTRVAGAHDQAALTGAERRTNLSGVFAAARPVSGSVLLVDDVVTTGATLQACASSLRSAGAGPVEAFAASSAFS